MNHKPPQLHLLQGNQGANENPFVEFKGFAEQVSLSTPYVSYCYGYPHKTAYRRFSERVGLHDLWATENTKNLFLYVHIPFCEMRCGFCNLFTQSRPQDGVDTFCETLERQGNQVFDCLKNTTFARAAIGGGTPTYLDAAQLERVLSNIERWMAQPISSTPMSVETSPETATAEKLSILKAKGVYRVSIGVQSFFDEETKAIARPQKVEGVFKALRSLRDSDFPILNLDLMYGLPGQTVGTFTGSIKTALEYEPEELYLYPLYVRPLTGLGKIGRAWDDQRIELYRAGRAYLLEHGYDQVSMRMFRSKKSPHHNGPVYCCQQDGMIGLGCGARSYSSALHYSDEFAVSNSNIRAIIEEYSAKQDADFRFAYYGTKLDLSEQKRRFVILSLLSDEGLNQRWYRERFNADVIEDFEELTTLHKLGYATITPDEIRLTAAGVERSDSIGPALYSPEVRATMKEFQLR